MYGTLRSQLASGLNILTSMNAFTYLVKAKGTRDSSHLHRASSQAPGIVLEPKGSQGFQGRGPGLELSGHGPMLHAANRLGAAQRCTIVEISLHLI